MKNKEMPPFYMAALILSQHYNQAATTLITKNY